MNLVKHFVLLFFCFWGTMLSGQIKDSLKLPDFLQMAQQANIAAKAAGLDWETARINFKLYQATLKPRLVANGNLPNFSRTSQEVIQPDGTIRFQQIRNNNSALGLSLTQNIAQTGGTFFAKSDLQRFDDFENDATFYNGVPVRIGLFQPLFGFNPYKYDQSLEPLRLREAQKKYLSDLETLNTDATRLFFNLLIAQVNLEIASTNQESNESLYEIAEERHALGKISDSDLMQLKVSWLNAQRSQRNALQSVRIVSADIYAFLGRPYSGDILACISPDLDNPVLIPYALALQEAIANRFEQDAFQRRIKETERDLAQAKGEGGFRADLTASYGLTRSAMALSDIYAQPQQEQFVQIQLTVPILDWGAQKSRVSLARAQQQFANEWVSQERLRFETEIRQSTDQYITVQEELGLAKELKTLAQERFEISKESFVLGAISITDLTIAQQEKDQALRAYTFVLSRYWQSFYEIRALTLYDFEQGRKLE